MNQIIRNYQPDASMDSLLLLPHLAPTDARNGTPCPGGHTHGHPNAHRGNNVQPWSVTPSIVIVNVAIDFLFGYAMRGQSIVISLIAPISKIFESFRISRHILEQ